MKLGSFKEDGTVKTANTLFKEFFQLTSHKIKLATILFYIKMS